MEVLGIDVGFGFTKATNGRDVAVFKSLIGEAAEIQYREQLLDQGAKDDYLHVQLDDGSYFVGDLAERQSNVRYFTLDQNQFVARFVRTLALASLTRMVDRNEPLRLITGLPVSYYRRHKDELTRILQGKHPVTAFDSQGHAQETVINIDKVRVVPQPFGSLFNAMLNDQGEAGDRRFLQEKIGVIDVGFRTVDYTISDRTRYSERGSDTTESGMAQAFATVAAKLQEKSGVDIELYRLFEGVERGSIKIRGKVYELRSITEKVFNQLAVSISTEVERLWADDWDIDAILVTGGGGVVLAPYLKPLLDGEVIVPAAGDDARLSNVRGYCRYGRYLWARGAPAQPAAASGGS